MNDKNNIMRLEWVGKADEDLLSLEALLKHQEGSPSTACFLAQQAIEKLLKSILVFHNAELEKIHDLVVLTNKVKAYEPEIYKFIDQLKTITGYYIETRYPADRPEFTWEQSKESFEVANKIREFAQSIS